MPGLDLLRQQLARLEEPLIFALTERARCKQDLRIYRPGGIALDGYGGSFLDYVLAEQAAVHTRARRHLAMGDPLARAFTPAPMSASVGDLIVGYYASTLVPAIAEEGDSRDAFATVLCDLSALQVIDRRIAYGIPIAEAKYALAPTSFDRILDPERAAEVRSRLRDAETEEKLLLRVRAKVEKGCSETMCHVDPQAVVDLFERCLMPVTLDVQVAHLLRRSVVFDVGSA